LSWKGESGVELFDAGELIDFLDHLFVIFFEFFDGFCVGAKTVGLEEVDLSLIERNVLLLFLLISHFKLFLNIN